MQKRRETRAGFAETDINFIPLIFQLFKMFWDALMGLYLLGILADLQLGEAGSYVY